MLRLRQQVLALVQKERFFIKDVANTHFYPKRLLLFFELAATVQQDVNGLIDSFPLAVQFLALQFEQNLAIFDQVIDGALF